MQLSVAGPKRFDSDPDSSFQCIILIRIRKLIWISFFVQIFETSNKIKFIP